MARLARKSSAAPPPSDPDARLRVMLGDRSEARTPTDPEFEAAARRLEWIERRQRGEIPKELDELNAAERGATLMARAHEAAEARAEIDTLRPVAEKARKAARARAAGARKAHDSAQRHNQALADRNRAVVERAARAGDMKPGEAAAELGLNIKTVRKYWPQRRR